MPSRINNKLTIELTKVLGNNHLKVKEIRLLQNAGKISLEVEWPKHQELEQMEKTKEQEQKMFQETFATVFEKMFTLDEQETTEEKEVCQEVELDIKGGEK